MPEKDFKALEPEHGDPETDVFPPNHERSTPHDPDGLFDSQDMPTADGEPAGPDTPEAQGARGPASD